jgi:hypothetical protein
MLSTNVMSDEFLRKKILVQVFPDSYSLENKNAASRTCCA